MTIHCRGWLGALALLALVARSHLHGQQVATIRDALASVRGAALVAAPPQYAAWYDEVVARCVQIGSCQVVRAPFEDIQWWVMPSAFHCNAHDDRTCLAVAWTNAGRIYIDRNRALDKRLVQHELLHMILGTGDHTREFVFLNLMVQE